MSSFRWEDYEIKRARWEWTLGLLSCVVYDLETHREVGVVTWLDHGNLEHSDQVR
jgi:hypothetical protein